MKQPFSDLETNVTNRKQTAYILLREITQRVKLFHKRLYFQWPFRLYYYRSRLIRRLLLRARDPEALALKYFGYPHRSFPGAFL